MAKNSKKIVPVSAMAVAILVECPMQAQRCRAGYVFKQGETKRIELSELTSEQLDLLNDDPYLKVVFEADETLEDVSEARILELEAELSDAKQQAELQKQAIQRAEVAEDKLNDLKSELEKSEDRVTALKAQLASKEIDLTAANEQINTLDDSLIKANAEIEELKAKVTELEKTATAPKAKK